MSVRVMAAVWQLDLPGTEKLVLLALADWSDDEGRCWPSMTQLAAKSGLTDRATRAIIGRLVQRGFLQRKETIGKGVDYRVTPGTSFPPEKSSPRNKIPKTPERRSANTSIHVNIPKKDKPSLVRAHELPDDWEPKDFGPNTESAKVVAGWPPGELNHQLEHFRAHHRKKGSKFKDWQAAWSTWVLKSRSFGNGYRSGPDSLRGSRPSAAYDMWRQATAELAAERGNSAPDFGTGSSLPAIRPG